MSVYQDWQLPIRWAWSLIYSLANTQYLPKSKADTLLLPDSQTTSTTLKLRALYDQAWRSISPTLELAQSPTFKPASLSLSIESRTRLTYERAKLICDAFNLTVEDALYLSPNFWKIQTDLIGSMDGGAITLITIQYNLFVGTVAPYAVGRPDLELILDRAMKFEISGQFLLTEVGHGLDARNLETTATLLPNGDFDLHSPNPAAAKCMPPTTPRSGLPTIGVVMAKLVVAGEDYGVRPFVVPLTDGQQMCKGVTSKVLPPRTGAHPIDHALTSFNHVRLPNSALLGPIEKPKNERSQFFTSIQRVSAGTLFLSAGCIPLLKNAIYNASLFSMRRKVKGHDGKPVAVIHFRTQHLPILHAIAQYHVLQAFFIKAAMEFRDVKYDPRVRHAWATVFKAVALQHFQKSIRAMNEGCGWHGYFEQNQILQSELEFRAVGTAEGDIRVLAIRLASELLLGRYQLSPPQNPTSLVAQHEQGLFAEATGYLHSIGGFHRSEKFNRNILPLSLPLVQAIGHRIALEAAQSAGIDSKLLALYESEVIREDSAWYAEQGGLSRKAQIEMEAKAADALLPDLERLVQETGARAYSNAPMASEKVWDEFVAGLEGFFGDASFDVGLGVSEKNCVEGAHL
ncbi:acyl-CoA dehydrogenase NM domain-like protein [Aspergillus steynii IBT 23096]|uniref:Acyl-CoA dehydrogenase NM domain-like protein n=1 Tax=Aspergillus steynii IBT 23096 TaxID=1392250 RepID=A0A2I2G0Q9_9EURO|nr:acyl-CoA dehydrogenase NM domain-like protein [Aspergillus steynii IBT 23096]PLB46467.1 acyl-CoA dehydrogenase NM domain-like protein [Aspergillus steynii IBT 23096]